MRDIAATTGGRSLSAPARFGYQPALDGVRAVAVTMVLLFHADVSWMSGGYFGVSVFFTLSGYLITSLLVREHASTGRIAPAAFYARRLRRLLPASMLCLGTVAVLGAFDVWKGVGHLRRDLLGALFQIANWVQLFAGESYTDLQSKSAGLASPLDHYWSLAIEEQFYWIWPLGFWALAASARRRGWSLTTMMVVCAAVAALAAPVTWVLWGVDAVYWATPARAAEILLGAAVATGLAVTRRRVRRWMAPAGLAAVVLLAVLLPATGGLAYHGGFPLLALATALLLIGLQRPGSVTSLLSLPPVVMLGRISYGVYLFHFPIFVLLSHDRTGVGGVALLAERLAVTISVAAISYRLVERPVRLSGLPTLRTVQWSFVATIAVLGLALTVPGGDVAEYYAVDADLAAAAAIQPVEVSASSMRPAALATGRIGATNATSTSERDGPLSPSEPAHEQTEPVQSAPLTSAMAASGPAASGMAATGMADVEPARIMVVGDSTAEATGAGLVAWAAAHPELAQVSLAVSAGCGFVRGGEVPSDEEVSFQRECDRLLDVTLPQDLTRLRPDVVMMMVTSRDIVPRERDEVGITIDPSDARYADRMRADYQAITDLITSTTSARVVWVRAPRANPFWLGRSDPFLDPDLLAIRQRIVEETVAANPERSQTLDLRAWMEADGIADDHDARPDGTHFSPEGALYVAEQWLGPRLVEAALIGRALSAGG